MKKLVLVLFIFINLSTIAKDSLFSQANYQYQTEKYSSAIALYENILENGYESCELYYNLGNCYFKKRDLANAIWYYEKSLKLNPNFKNASDNLYIAKSKIIDKIEPLPILFYQKWWNSVVSLLSTKKWQIISLLCIWVTIIVKFIFVFFHYKKRYFINSIYFISIILFLISHVSEKINFEKKEAIIFESPTSVHSAPTLNSTNLFSLHEGTKIEILDRIDKWVNIQLKNGNSGWIKKEACKILE